ncbi:uncharacterized protein BYT42DRAFT_81713 [Radiomyces spectabilis]|uniref:uncharacterized protein n=1 Tax=Radiomyces spectabilis TaxID=64574 RepID=UPI00221F7979|nr:uncharacterized protein BYT42DRAFT_81713 [Radiomyces spectabilis]KAI8371782.1 hypothetical protein BYT42DRAFT_81713 [Radiomyces spectabilis]
MNDEDDLLDDNFLTSDFLDALERQESQFYSTQQGATTRVGEASMSAAPRIAPVIMRDPNVVEATSNARVWDSTSREDIESQLKEKTQVIDNLRFAVDQLRSKVIHDETLRDNALRELERFRTELNFKSHELDSARRELHALKVKHARTEEPTPSYDNARQSNTNSRKRSTFPDTMAFIPSKRANYRRATPAPSTSPMSVALESISSAAPTITSPQKEPTPVLIPPLQEKTVPHPTKNQGKILLKHLLRKVYEEWCREQHQPFDHHFYESPTLTSELCTKLAHKLMPAEYVTEGHRKLAMLASDLVQCMAMVSYKDVAIVIQQMMSILGLCISISRKEKLINVFRQAVNIIHTLTSSYKESSQYLLSDLHRGKLIHLI